MLCVIDNILYNIPTSLLNVWNIISSTKHYYGFE